MLGRLVHTPEKDLLSFWLFPSAPETPGREAVKPESPRLPGWGAPWGFTPGHYVTGFPREVSVQPAEAGVFMTRPAPTTQESTAASAAETDALPDGVPAVCPEHRPGQEADAQQLLCRKKSV